MKEKKMKTFRHIYDKILFTGPVSKEEEDESMLY
jgi:hypothetical protein